VFDRVLRKMQELVWRNRYVITFHGVEEMEADRLTPTELESCILTGQVIGRERDRRTREWKYLVRGNTSADDEAVVVAKCSGPQVRRRMAERSSCEARSAPGGNLKGRLLEGARHRVPRCGTRCSAGGDRPPNIGSHGEIRPDAPSDDSAKRNTSR